MVAKGQKEQTALVMSTLQMGWNSTIERTPQSDNDGVMFGQQDGQNGTLDGRMKATDNHPIRFYNLNRPLLGERKRIGWCSARRKKGDKRSI